MSREKVEAATRELVLTNDQLQKVSSLLLNEFNEGLSRETHHIAAVKMLPTFVRDVPNGSERGKFLALDLGGTNFRVLLITLDGDQIDKTKIENTIFAIPQEIMLGSGEQLFDHIADCLATFMEQHNLKGSKLPLGFTFSFPCKQEGLTKARLVTWTKGFRCSGVVGEDVVELLRKSIRKRDVEIDVMAVVNDTTGTLMSCAHKNRNCRVGLIIGTGTNACFMEQAKNVDLFFDEDEPDAKEVIVNTEWGAFGDNGVLDFLRTDWDDEVDSNSMNKGRYLFEKMISGMYVGELVRSIIADLTKKGLLFGGKGSQKLFTAHEFGTAYVSWIESDTTNTYSETRRALAQVDIEDITVEDCENLKLICQRVSTRAAHLVSAGVATILNKIKRDETTVGVDGSVFRYHPYFHKLMDTKIAELTDPAYKFNLMLSEDGSGRGAALVAAVAVRHQQARIARMRSLSLD